MSSGDGPLPQLLAAGPGAPPAAQSPELGRHQRPLGSRLTEKRCLVGQPLQPVAAGLARGRGRPAVDRVAAATPGAAALGARRLSGQIGLLRRVLPSLSRLLPAPHAPIAIAHNRWTAPGGVPLAHNRWPALEAVEAHSLYDREASTSRCSMTPACGHGKRASLLHCSAAPAGWRPDHLGAGAASQGTVERGGGGVELRPVALGCWGPLRRVCGRGRDQLQREAPRLLAPLDAALPRCPAQPSTTVRSSRAVVQAWQRVRDRGGGAAPGGPGASRGML